MADQQSLREEIEQQAGDETVKSSETRCPTCGEKGILVSERQVAEGGPLLLEGWTVHQHDGNVHYHS